MKKILSLVCMLLLLYAPLLIGGTNNVYQVSGTSFSFKDAGGNALLNLRGVKAGQGEISDVYDMGNGAIPRMLNVFPQVNFTTSATSASGLVRVYACSLLNSTAGSMVANQAITVEGLLVNWTLIGQIAASSTAGAVGPFYSSMVYAASSQYVQFGIFNGGTIALADVSATNTTGSQIVVVPVYDQIQATAELLVAPDHYPGKSLHLANSYMIQTKRIEIV
jgi:hypothetical protein